MSESQREREKSIFYPLVPSTLYLQKAAMARELQLDRPRACRGSRTWAILCHFTQTIHRELGQLELEPVPKWDAGTTGGGFTRYTKRCPHG